MTDQCRYCISRGDFKACQAAPCSKHEDWHAIQLKQKLEAAEAKLATAGYDAIMAAVDEAAWHNNRTTASIKDLEEYANKLKAGEV